ncbi:MAG: DapH/DapD/GlmU-related protein [Peptococcaceae bacterium]|nr:DapH/DapD/GlmU-related protein [Peptococcaceae bacterium]
MPANANAILAASAIVAADAVIGPFCVVGENVSIGAGARLGVGCVLADGVKIAAGCTLGNYVTLGDGASVGAGVQINDHTTLCPGTQLGDNSYIGAGSVIGRLPRAAATSTVKAQPNPIPLRLGANCTIGCCAVLYAGTTYGKGVFIGDNAMVRERCNIGDSVVIGSGVAVENDTAIGAYTKIQTGAYITAYMQIAEKVFIAPMVTTTNDNFMGRTEKRFQHIKGPTIERGARVGGGSIILPGVKIAPESFIAAGALVTKDTASGQVSIGFPAQTGREVPQEELLP